MQGYNDILTAAKKGERLNKVFFYVDAMPYRIRKGSVMKKFPVNVMFVDSTDDPAKLSFHALRDLQVHIVGGNNERVRAFAERVLAFKPSMLCWDDGCEMEIIRFKQ